MTLTGLALKADESRDTIAGKVPIYRLTCTAIHAGLDIFVQTVIVICKYYC